MPAKTEPASPYFTVRKSVVHGNGVFARRKIPAETCILEYVGKRISWAEADRRHPTNPDDPFHTLYFALEDGRVIDGNQGGNDGRWINHSCEPNCEAREEKGRVFVYALRDIPRGEELNYDYGLVLDVRHTAKVKAQYQCLCGAPTCRGTMLAPKKR